MKLGAAGVVIALIGVGGTVGCQSAPPPEYEPDAAVAAGIYRSEPRWTVRTGRETTRPLGALAQWRPPAATAMAGLGIVVGLHRTGDTGAAAQALLDYWHQQVNAGALGHVEPPERPGSAALVAVEAVLPADGAPGPAEVRLIGNATSLEGGRLLTTALRAGTETLATAEGPLILTRVADDGTVSRDRTKGRAPRVIPRRRPDARRLEFWMDDSLPGATDAVRGFLADRVPGVKFQLEKGPPTRLFAALPRPMPREELDALLQAEVTVTIGEPGVVVIARGEDGRPCVDLLGPPAALGLVSLRVERPLPDNPAAFVRIVGVPRYAGHDYRRALVEFDSADGRRVRVICPNTLADLVPVLDRVGLGIQDVASCLSQAHDAGALAQGVVVIRKGLQGLDVPDDQGDPAGGR